MGNEHSSQRQAQTKTQQQSEDRAIASKQNQATRAAVHPWLQLQRQIGNRAVTQLIQAKLTVNPADDIYEQEADRTALAVVNSLNAPASPTAQRQEMPEEEDKIQTKPLIQRMSAESGMEVTPQLEESIQQARGSGQPLADSIREPIEQAVGADFSGVRIHTDAQADQFNQSIQAKAFTTGEDVFFKQGAYNPGSQGGQELIAHELTHVVQQNNQAIQRSSVTLHFLGEQEADAMGAKAGSKTEQRRAKGSESTSGAGAAGSETVQRKRKWTPQQRAQSEKFWKKKHEREQRRADAIQAFVSGMSREYKINITSQQAMILSSHGYSRGEVNSLVQKRMSVQDIVKFCEEWYSRWAVEQAAVGKLSADLMRQWTGNVAPAGLINSKPKSFSPKSDR
ncbi:hypothetical protein NIES2100_63220 [Calothrix sp. NIES-2100]|uniref:eCIS core domain-containing protein n=1 Tax=Calothrix sp. NIES-2100 TaxID=1954172 RepID=UPI000B5E7ECB|nr:hypothetical protein NIES2100_63220 [Calothrix sp. NIES-2100]